MRFCNKCKKTLPSRFDFYKVCPYCGSQLLRVYTVRNLNSGEKEYATAEKYYTGNGVGKNLEEAFSWYMKAAEQL